MVGAKNGRWLTVTVGVAGLLAALLVGTELRLRDPLSSPVLPAEDVYTHMALVREHVEDGTLNPYHSAGRLYPPGMHASLAVFWVYTGADLYAIMRFAPLIYGLVGILGVGLLLWRYEGPAAAIVGAFATAMAPEIIFRESMMAPTAVDLALLPFALFAVMEVMIGRVAWIPAAFAMVLFLVYAHPWVLSILSLAMGAFALFGMGIPWPRRRSPPIRSVGLAAAIAILGVGLSLSLWGCNGTCGTGFEEVIPNGERLNGFAPLLGLAALGAAGVILVSRKRLDELLRPEGIPQSLTGKLVSSLIIAFTIFIVTAPAKLHGFPRFVDPPYMLGWPALFMAALGLIIVPFVRGPVAMLGASIITVTYPFVIYNPFNSPFWPHRTAVYLGVGVVIMAGVAAAAIFRALLAGVEHVRTSTRSPRPRFRWHPMYAALIVILVSAPMVGVVYAETPAENHPLWYRLYDECEMGAMQQIADAHSANPSSVVIVGSWHAKLVISALGTDTDNVWLKTDFYTDPNQRHSMENMAVNGRPVIVVVEKHLKPETPKADTEPLTRDPWQVWGSWCTTTKTPVIAYNVQGGTP